MAEREPRRHLDRMKSYLRFLVSLLLASALVALAGTGCQTSKGLGKDIENLGEKIQDKAK